ncbi:MAG: signal recognition particle receptor subunit alpha [Candidatus ainarchaeum sp.]|nr:signal recognition particle receptor subunit alpha [Candidatus ainarchaeum sp.]
MGLGEKLHNAMEMLRKATVFDRETIKEAIKEIQRALIAADVEVQLVLDLTKKIEAEAFKELPKGLTRREHVLKITYELLVELIGGTETKAPEKPKRILLVGLYGQGKTTTVSKLAKYYSKRGLKIGIVCADTYRPAAFEQLKQLSEKLGIAFYGNPKEKKADAVVKEALKQFSNFDLAIVDSAGRDAFNAELVSEIKAVNNVFRPDYKWLVIGADVGQLAKKQAIAFHDAVGVNGVIITRMDGSAKGGGALSACNIAKCPVVFIGTGEKAEDLEEFDAQRFLSRVMGYGDLQGLLEKAKELSEEQELSPEEILQGAFNLETFYQQLKATKKMGSIGKIAEMLGMKMQVPKEILETTEEKLDSFKIIMDSMTKQEKTNPDLLNHKRIERVSKGSGKTESQVRELLKQFKQMQKVFKKFKGLDEAKLEKMQKNGKLDFGKLLQGFGPKKKQKFKIR